MNLSHTQIAAFKDTVYNYYKSKGRFFPWRVTVNPYHILVSEVMLQQTQTERVIPKYELFIKTFPDFATLADASLKQVLTVWQGLGYNRRAKLLRELAQIVIDRYNGILPQNLQELIKLPSIGTATASSMCAFAFNLPTIFIETNIRTVFIHFFFKNKQGISDKELFPLVETTLDRNNPREWYWALMDYGAMLKSIYPNPNRKSIHYRHQSRFEGSIRQVRGLILKTLIARKSLSFEGLVKEIDKREKHVKEALDQLLREEFVIQKNKLFYLKDR